MLPLISEENKSAVYGELIDDVAAWRKVMIHYVKEENPEINAAIIDVANSTSLDPKAVALGAYMVYKMLEIAAAEESSAFEEFVE